MGADVGPRIKETRKGSVPPATFVFKVYVYKIGYVES